MLRVLFKPKILTLTLLLVGCFVVLTLSINTVQAASDNQHYVIQLKGNDNSILKAIPGLNNIELLFEGDSNSEFANTYRFSTASSLEVLQQTYAGFYNFLEPDSEFTNTASRKNKSKAPNDPGFSSNPDNTDRQWALHKANFVKAWEKTTGSRDVVVAVIDTGVDTTHTDFSRTKFVAGYNTITQKAISRKTNSDDNGHGTLVTGVIAATANNEKGIVGAAYGVSIMPIKALDSDGTGASSNISEAIVWAADHDADVINLSLGGIGFAHDTVLANAITYAFDRNVVIVAAAGNDVAVTGGNLDKEPVFPICNDNDQNMIIGVTATDIRDLKPSFANFGKACVDVSAPGKRIISTINHDPSTGGESSDSYAYASGTSLAVPYVSAQAALLRSLFPGSSNRQIRDRILVSSDPIDALNLSQCAGQSCQGLLGSGRINAAKSLEDQIVVLSDGDVVQVSGTTEFYLINGGKRQVISLFVKSQRFANAKIKMVSRADLNYFPEGSYAVPLDGSLVKSPNSATVYYIQNGLRRPLTGQVFSMRGFKYSAVVTVSNAEIDSWVVGSFMAPPDGSLVRTANNPTIYWVVNGILHAVNGKFYTERALNLFPVIIVGDKDISQFSIGEPYVL